MEKEAMYRGGKNTRNEDNSNHFKSETHGNFLTLNVKLS